MTETSFPTSAGNDKGSRGLGAFICAIVAHRRIGSNAVTAPVKQSIILGVGTGRCGTGSLAKVLNEQNEAVCSYEEPPLLPWRAVDAQRVLRERFARFRTHAKARLLGDVGSFYLPYLEDAIALETGYPDRLPSPAAGGGGHQLLRVARPVDAAAHEPLGPATRPRLAPRRQPHAHVSSIRDAEPRGRDSPLLGRVLPAGRGIGGPLSRAGSHLRHLPFLQPDPQGDGASRTECGAIATAVEFCRGGRGDGPAWDNASVARRGTLAALAKTQWRLIAWHEVGDRPNRVEPRYQTASQSAQVAAQAPRRAGGIVRHH